MKLERLLCTEVLLAAVLSISLAFAACTTTPANTSTDPQEPVIKALYVSAQAANQAAKLAIAAVDAGKMGKAAALKAATAADAADAALVAGTAALRAPAPASAASTGK